MKICKCKLGDLLQIKQGYAFKSEKYVEHSSYRLCTLGNFGANNNFKFNDAKATYYPDSFPKEFILQEGDLVLPLTEQTVGLFGNSAFIPHTEDYTFVLNQRVGKVMPTPKADLVFLHYLLSTKLVRDQIEATASGTKQRNTSPDKIYDVDVWVPDLEGQQKIGSFLHRFEQKIDINNKIIEQSEKLSNMLYNYWFAQFDFPNEEGAPYRSTGGPMQWNDELKCEIPVGWNIGNLYTIATPINGLACQKYRPKENEEFLPVVKITEMHDGITLDTEKVSINIPSKYKIFDGDILFSWSATLEVMYWFGGKAGLNQHIFKVVPKAGYSTEYVYHQFSAYVINFVKMAEARKTTMGHITTDHLEQSRIVLPPADVMQAFSELVAPIHQKIGHCRKENRELTKLRDWLLPMLMNGQVTVADAEEEVSKVIPFAPQTVEVRQAARNFGDKKTDDTPDLVKAFMRRKKNDSKA